MPKLSLQFHADRDEIGAWIAGWVREFNLAVAVETVGPAYSVRQCDPDDLAAEMHNPSNIDRVALSRTPILVTAASSLEFLLNNPNVLTVTLGKQSQTELREASLSAMTDDTDSLKVWRSIRARAKASLLSGSTVVNPVTGAEQRAKAHYYSAGARQMAIDGVRLLATAGWNEYRLDG